MIISQKQMAIQFENVTYSKKGDTILSNITGFFPKGEITTLVGPSGAGKTTVLKLCNNLLSASSGEIEIDGQKIELYDPLQLRRSVGLALQQAPMIAGSVFTNLSLPLTLQNRKLSSREAEKLLTTVGLNVKMLSRHINHLSGGQRQKLSIARTLVNEPHILLLDEITSSLDQNSAEEIEQLIKKINLKYDVTVIWITHDIEQAKKIGDYVWIMMEGELVESGPIDILNEPETEHAKRFLKGNEL